MKKKIVATGAALMIAAVTLAGCGSAPAPAQAPAETKAIQPETKAPAVPAPESETETPAAAVPDTGVYEVDGISVNYYDSVHNDESGNWRLAVIYDGSDLNEYAADFYKYFGIEDSQVFGIVNLGLNTSARISRVMGEWLDVSITEYQKGEEHDAKKLFGGPELSHYWLNMETGETDYDLD